MTSVSASHGLLGLFSRHSTLRALVTLAAGATTLAACTTWRTTLDQPQAVVAQKPGAVKVTRHGGQQVTVYSPAIAGDSLVGYGRLAEGSPPIALPLSDVQSVQVERVAVGRTVLLAVALGATVLLVASAVASGGRETTVSSPTDNGCCTSSCPLVYGWDGTQWRLASGTFGGAIARPLQFTVVDNLDSLAPQDGSLRLKVTNELDETDYLDALAVLAVDHEPGLTVASDPAAALHAIGALVPPVSATDFRGADALPRVREADGWGWESSVSGRDTARAADLRDGLRLSFLRPSGVQQAHLVVDASNTPWAVHLLDTFIGAHGAATDVWYDSLNTQPALARALGMRLAGEGFLAASVRTSSGWTSAGSYQLVGPERSRRQVLDLDLSQVVGDTVDVRLESAPALWLVDRVAMDFTADRALTVRELPLVSALDRARRDVAPLLAAADGRDYVLEIGDAAELRFRVPEPGAGTSRTFLLRTTGWYRVHLPAVDPPDVAMLDAVMHAPLGVSRTSVARLNLALAGLRPVMGASGTPH